MKRKLAVVFALMLAISFINPKVGAAQLAEIGFEGFGMTHFSSGASVENASTWTKVASFTVSYPDEKYLTGVSVKWRGLNLDTSGDGTTATAHWKIKVVVGASTQTGALHSGLSGSFHEAFSFTGLRGTSFTVDIYAQAYGGASGDTPKVVVDDVYIYSMDEDYGVKSKLTELKYVPPGADGTDNGLLLNKTEVLLDQTYSLSEGAISFWLKWDGTGDITLSDNIGLDSHGYLYVTSSTTTYKLEGVTPPVGTYVPVYISWGSGMGYIMLNSTKILLNWEGNLTISKVGELNNESTTLIDEFRLYDTYIPPEAFESGSDTATVNVAFSNATVPLTITTMDGSSIDSLTLSAYSPNWTLLDTTTWELGQNPTLNVTNYNGTFVVIEGATASTTIFVSPNDGTLNVTIPGTSAQYVTASIEPATYPSQEQRVWEWLIVKDSQGQLVYRNKWNFASTDVVLKSGGAYLIEVATANLTESQVVFTGLASSTIKINLPSVSQLKVYDELTTYYRVDNTSLQIYYYDPDGLTEDITVVLYDVYDHVLLNVTYPNTNLLNFKTTILPYKFVLTFERENRTVVWPQIVGHIEEGVDSPFSMPKELTSLVIVLMMLFSFSALDAAWAPIMTLVFGMSLAIGGIITLPAQAATFLSIGGFLAFMSQARLNFLSIKQLASQALVILLLLQIGGTIADVIASETGLGGVGFGINSLAEQSKEQLVFWQNYTPQYTDLGAPISSDTKDFWYYAGRIFGGAKFVMMSLGAPEAIANALQVLIWLLEAALGLYLFLGREV